MTSSRSTPRSPQTLDAIDATLAGEPVDPRFAEIAELALLLTAERPQPAPAFAASTGSTGGAAVRPGSGRGAAAPPPDPVGAGAGVGRGNRRGRGCARRRGRARRWRRGVFVFVLIVVGERHACVDERVRVVRPGARVRPWRRRACCRRPGSPRVVAVRGVGPRLAGAERPRHAVVSLSSSAASSAAAPTPPSSGRKIIQSAQLSLTTPPARIDTVAQEVFNVVGSQGGFVQRSNVTAAGAGNAYAQFQLSVPSSNLSQTMAQLSQLKFATVSSRTDATQDVNDQYVGDVRRLADAKALRTALLKQLANAVTTSQIDSLNQQIHDADSAISAAQSTLNSLNHQIDYSQIQVTINGALIAPAQHHKNTGFTLGTAAHDSGRVLTVAAGVALIALAALVPIVLLTALGWWVVTAVRRRRREQALDLA